MNNRNRKYARTMKKCSCNSSTSLFDNDNEEEELCSFSGTAALGILAGTFLVGMVSGKLLCMLMKD